MKRFFSPSILAAAVVAAFSTAAAAQTSSDALQNTQPFAGATAQSSPVISGNSNTIGIDTGAVANQSTTTNQATGASSSTSGSGTGSTSSTAGQTTRPFAGATAQSSPVVSGNNNTIGQRQQQHDRHGDRRCRQPVNDRKPEHHRIVESIRHRNGYWQHEQHRTPEHQSQCGCGSALDSGDQRE
jgi:hypothetical protein